MTTFKIKQEPRPEIMPEIIPDILCDAATKKRYQRGRFLGKGDFSKCYELTDLDDGKMFAVKIVSKQLLVKPQLNKMAREIYVHSSLKHEHVVGYHSFFNDDNFVYLVLELFEKRSLKELYDRRKAVTEPEARYFMHQLLLGVKYLHENKMIHRDLKLENLFLNDNMELKIGGFGFATKLNFTGERKKRLCGTPNYMAPEVINMEGHSFEVDIWSMGCILYTLLVGSHPFETQSLKDTYSKIKRNEYHIPSQIGPLARALITRMLQGDPACRPAVDIVLNDEFMTCGYTPTRLPLSCLTMAPRFDAKLNSSIIAVRRPLGEVNRVHLPGTAELPQGEGLAHTNELNHGEDAAAVYTGPAPKKLLGELQQQLSRLFKAKPSEKFPLMMDEAEDPGSVPMVWISKWVDFKNYGFGYQLSDDTIGLFFNDLTTLLLLVDAKTIQYVERNGNGLYYTMDQHPDTLDKKVKLLAYYRAYMQNHSIKTGASVVPRDGDEHLRLRILRQCFRTSRAVVMHLTSGTLQINFEDHVKLILCPRMGAVTVIDEKENFRTFKFSLLAEHGCNTDLLNRLQHAHEILPILLSRIRYTEK